jgi:subtilisin family serine protease
MRDFSAILTARRLRWAGLVLFALSAQLAAQTEVTPSGPLNLRGAATPVKTEAIIYIVQMRQAPAASYRGGVAGFAPTRPNVSRSIDSASSPVQSYVQFLEQSHDRVLTEVGAARGKLYSYRYAFNGFAAELTPAQAARLAQHAEVERIWPDAQHQIRTNNSAIFLGLENPAGGLRADLKLRGEDIIIGVIDSGIAPNHPSLSDVETRIPRACSSQWARSSWLGRWLCHAARRNPPTVRLYGPPAAFRGSCEPGENFSTSDCNNKLVGARFYADGFLFTRSLDPGEFLSPRDADGHGTHIATTAAGNAVSAQILGTRVGRVAGIAPRARVAVYKACWLEPGATRASCATSDLTRAIDDAVADGVHIINYSVGNLDAEVATPNDIALLTALDAGVLSVVAAGNDGPELGTIGSPSSAPWVLTVAASTQAGTRFEEAIEILTPADLAGALSSREASFTPQLGARGAIEERVIVADDGQNQSGNGLPGSRRDACEPLINGAELSGRIALIERGGCNFQVKIAHAEQAGAIAVIVYNNIGSPIVMNGERGSVNIPAVMIGTGDGQRLVNRLAAETVVRARLEKGTLLERNDSGNRLGDFSSRGPALGDPDFMKPDLTAPGINILAGHTPDVANGLPGESFQYLTGTSMSTPVVAGIAALLKEANPDWSPAMLMSALTTTASGGVVLEDGLTSAHPFETGAGHVSANRAVDPGLVYDAEYADYVSYLCGRDRPPFTPADCASLAPNGTQTGRQVNRATIGVRQLISNDRIIRRVTNVGPSGTYTAALDLPAGFSATIEPNVLSIASGQSAQYEIAFQTQGAPLDLWSFGTLTWSDGTRSVRSPLALRPATLRAPEEIWLGGQSGATRIPVAFGYSGQYFAGAHGLRAPLVIEGVVDEDPTRRFSFRFDSGVSAHFVDIPANQLYARFALFDEFTDGDDDLDLYLFYCPNDECFQVGQSGSFTSEEEIDLVFPEPGIYAALIHGYQTDPANGLGANYSLFAWSVGISDAVGNLVVSGPDVVVEGDRFELDLDWSGLAADTRYFGVISHNTPGGINLLTLVNVDTGASSTP